MPPTNGDQACLVAALEILALFAVEAPQKHRSTRRRSRSTLQQPTRAEAQILVQQIASEYRENLQRDHYSPRLKAVVDELRAVGLAAKELQERIRHLSPVAKLALSPGWTYLRDDHRNAPTITSGVFDRALGHSLEGQGRNQGRKDWEKRLVALDKLTDLAIRFLVSRYGSGDVDQPDRGGSTNLHKLMYGSAKRQLVLDCWNLFEACRPREATGTIDSKDERKTAFYRFVCKVYELATGERDPDLDGTSLTRFVTEVAGQQRRFHDLVDQRDDRRERIAELHSIGTLPVADSTESTLLKSLIDQQKTLERELRALAGPKMKSSFRKRKSVKRRPSRKRHPLRF